jgi:hypothetical protein
MWHRPREANGNNFCRLFDEFQVSDGYLNSQDIVSIFDRQPGHV